MTRSPAATRPVAAALLGLAVAVSLLQGVRATSELQTDFAVRYAAAQLAKDGGDPYDLRTIEAAQTALNPGSEPFQFVDPPITAVVLRPLTALPAQQAAYLWFALSVLALAAIALFASRLAGGRAALWLVGVALLMSPGRSALNLGQVDPVFLLPLIGSWALLLRPTPTAATALGGALAGASMLKPQLVLVPALLLFVLHARRSVAPAVAGAAVIAAAGLGLPVLLAKEATHDRWLARLSDTASEGLNLGLLLLAGVLVAAAARHVRRASTTSLLLVACALTMAFAGVVRWNPQWFLAVLIPALVLLHHRRQDDPPAAGYGLAACFGLLLGDALQPLSVFVGVTHALRPVLIVGCLLAAGLLSRRFSVGELAVAGAVNAAVTLPPFGPNMHVAFGLLAATGLVLLLNRQQPAPVGTAPSVAVAT